MLTNQFQKRAILQGFLVSLCAGLSACNSPAGSSAQSKLSPELRASDASLLYVQKSGDTMTGPLALPADGLSIGSGEVTVAGGNVGIGTTSPVSPLDVESANPDAAMTINNSAFASGGYAGRTGQGAALRVSNIVAGTTLNASLLLMGGYRPNLTESGWIQINGNANTTTGGGVNIVIPAPGFDPITTPGQFLVASGDGNGFPTLFSITPPSNQVAASSTASFAGSVGVGTTTPKESLDINGLMRMKTTAGAPPACDATHAGAVGLTSAYKLCVCNGANWNLPDGVTACPGSW